MRLCCTHQIEHEHTESAQKDLPVSQRTLPGLRKSGIWAICHVSVLRKFPARACQAAQLEGVEKVHDLAGLRQACVRSVARKALGSLDHWYHYHPSIGVHPACLQPSGSLPPSLRIFASFSRCLRVFSACHGPTLCRCLQLPVNSPTGD
jgi:hypothetical protein